MLSSSAQVAEEEGAAERHLYSSSFALHPPSASVA